MTEEATDFEAQTRDRLTALLELLEKDRGSLGSAGSDVYGPFIDEVRRGLDNLDRKSGSPVER